MSSIENPNRYDPKEDPDLHEAWSDGFRAGQNDDPVPKELADNPSEEARAWIGGYTAAQLL